MPDEINMDDRPEWTVESSKEVGDYTLTRYDSGRVLVTVTATGAGVRAGLALQLMFDDIA